MVNLGSFFPGESSQKKESKHDQNIRQNSVNRSKEELNALPNTKNRYTSTASLKEYGECYKTLGKSSTAVISVCKSKMMSKDSQKYVIYAVKRFRKRDRTETERAYMKRLTSEFCISSIFCHQNIIETLDLVLDGRTRYCTVMEYCPGGDLFSAIVSGHMTDIEKSCCFKQLIRGISYLHSVGVAHRDIKPENLLLASDGTLKITDFGVSDVFQYAWEKNPRKCHGLVGSEPYIAPEAYEKDPEYWGSTTDIWSAGIVFYTIWEGGHAWLRADKRSDNEFCSFIHHHPTRTYSNFKDFSRKPRDLLYRMLHPNPNERPTASQILEHDWVKSVLLCKNGIDTKSRKHFHTKSE
ncbi:unnamed protein product [Rhizopus stolonifer]